MKPFYFVIVLQDFLQNNLAELINRHLLQDSANILGQCIIELGRAETYIVRASNNVSGMCHNKRALKESGLQMKNFAFDSEKNLT